MGPGWRFGEEVESLGTVADLIRPEAARSRSRTAAELRHTCPQKRKAQDGLQGGANNWPIRAPNSLLPRARTLWTNSKNPRYSGRLSWGIPR